MKGNALSKFCKSVNEVGWTQTWRKLKYNYALLETPESLLRRQIIGYLGTMFGVVIGIIFVIPSKTWWLSIILGFTLLVMYAQFKGALKQLKTLRKIQEEFDDGV